MKIFLSTPVSCYEVNDEFINYKKNISILIDRIKKEHMVCSEIEKIYCKNDYDTPEKSISSDLDSINACDLFILHYPKRVVTSALIELGMAIALNKPILIITPKQCLLPYLALGIPIKCNGSGIVEIDCFDEYSLKTILSIIRTY